MLQEKGKKHSFHLLKIVMPLYWVYLLLKLEEIHGTNLPQVQSDIALWASVQLFSFILGLDFGRGIVFFFPLERYQLPAANPETSSFCDILLSHEMRCLRGTQRHANEPGSMEMDTLGQHLRPGPVTGRCSGPAKWLESRPKGAWGDSRCRGILAYELSLTQG